MSELDDLTGELGRRDGPVAPMAAGRILVVCTGNICRSPYIERRLAQLLSGTGIEISSAGTDALVGNPIEPGSVVRLQQVGAVCDAFAARRIDRQLIDAADLVLTATREHRAQVVRVQPKALRFCFSLGDFSHLAQHIAPSQPEPGESWVAHVTRLVATVRGSVPARSADESDIIDPYRRGDHFYDQMVSQIEREIGPVIDVLVPRPHRPHG